MKNRISQNNIVEFIVNCILHMIILFTILIVFFLFYVNNFGKKTYEKNISKNYVPFIKNYIDNLSVLEKKYLLNFLYLNSENIEILGDTIDNFIVNKETRKVGI